METPNGKIEHPLPHCDKKFFFGNSLGLMYEAEHVHKCISEGLLYSPLMTHEESIELSKIMDEVRRNIGVEI